MAMGSIIESVSKLIMLILSIVYLIQDCQVVKVNIHYNSDHNI